MQQYDIPTAEFATFTEPKSALDYLSKKSLPIVIKADGLAAGKGVVIAHSADEAQHAVMTILSGDAHGDAGKKIVIEEFIQGEEVSFICVVDHDTVVPLASSQDHKARDEGDLGPNTGGMGAYSPSPLVDQSMHEKIMNQVILPTVNGFMDVGHPYQGFLYAGIMITPEGQPKVLEFNCRLGDPETQPIMLRLQDDLSELCSQGAANQLSARELKWSPQSALGVVLASGGYPSEYSKGDKISGLDHVHAPHAKIFHAGTVRTGNDIKTAGGRVLCVTALGDDVKQAQQNAYAEAKRISWDNMFYRKDIGYRAIKD
jgi:phosphoribosylamine--glycine ligase